MAVRIRMKKLGRRHRPFYRICAMDSRTPRDGRALEELGTYDPMIPDTDARVVLNSERIDYWLSVGALPSEKVKVLIKKYGTNGTHLEQQAAALEKLNLAKAAKKVASVPVPADQAAGEAAAADQPAVGSDTDEADEVKQEEPAQPGR